jgi:hypothetical protein
MSIEPTLPELQTGEVRDLIEHYKKGSIGPSEEVELFELINELKKKYPKVFKLRDVLKKSFDYTDFEIKRLDSEFNKWLKKQVKQDSSQLEPRGPEPPAIVTSAKQVGIGGTKALLGELQELGNVLVLQYAQKAALRGKGLKDYVIECVEFYEQNGDRISEIMQTNDNLKALTSILVQAVKPQFKLMAASRMYLDFITQLIQLSALGYEVDENFTSGVMQKIELAMGIKLA